MADIKKSAAQLIGRTPLLEASNYAESQGIADVVLLAKLEYLNPAGSVKDRVALSMIEDAEKSGILKKGATIIEPTSGNTGIGLASVAAAKGYKAVFTLPETMSIERRKLLKAYGAKLVLTDGSKTKYRRFRHSGAVHQCSQSCCPQEDDRTGDLGRYGRSGRYLCGRYRYRRHNHRCGPIPQGA